MTPKRLLRDCRARPLVTPHLGGRRPPHAKTDPRGQTGTEEQSVGGAPCTRCRVQLLLSPAGGPCGGVKCAARDRAVSPMPGCVRSRTATAYGRGDRSSNGVDYFHRLLTIAWGVPSPSTSSIGPPWRWRGLVQLERTGVVNVRPLRRSGVCRMAAVRGQKAAVASSGGPSTTTIHPSSCRVGVPARRSGE